MLTLPTLIAALVPSLVPAAPAASTAADVYALRASKVHVGDGRVLEDGVIVIEDGLVRSVGEAAPEGVAVTDVDGEIAPGFIAMRDATGAGSENDESTRKFTPTADVSLAFDPASPAWAHLLSQGITTVVMTPSSSSVAGGLDAIVSPGLGEVVKRRAALHLSVSSRSLSSFIEPTSYAGLYGHLEKHFAETTEGSPFVDAKAGTLRVMIEAFSKTEVIHALQFAKKHGLRGVIIGAPEAGEQIELLRSIKFGVVFESLSAGASNDVLQSSVALRKAGIPFAFTSDARVRGAAAMRMTAAACMRAGLDSHAALAAMTKSAADLLGVSKTHGTLEAGKVADFVVWSGAPTELTSHASHVYAGGKLVHQAHR